jgi:hypothetical protein
MNKLDSILIETYKKLTPFKEIYFFSLNYYFKLNLLFLF